MLALQVVAGVLLLAGSLAVVAFLRWLDAQEPGLAERSPARPRPVARRAAARSSHAALRRAA